MARAVTSRQSRSPALAYALLAPSLFGVLAFLLLPILVVIWLSLYRWDMLTPAQFAGLGNFTAMFADPLLYRSLANTCVFALASLLTHLVGGLLLALGVNRLKNKVLSYFVRTSLFVPFVISWAAVALLWKYVLDPSFGLVTY